MTHVHVKPNKNKSLNPIGTSDATYEYLFHTLVADGFSGTASIEHWGTPKLMLKGVSELQAAIDGTS